MNSHPNTIKYTKSIKPGTIHLPESIKIGIENNNTLLLAKKGEKIRYTSKITVYTNKTLKIGEDNHIIIPVYVGENKKTDNNTLLGVITIGSNDINEELPINSRIDIHTQIENLNQIDLSVHIPHTKQTLRNKFNYNTHITSKKELQEMYAATLDTLNNYKDNCIQNNEINSIINKIEDEEMIEYLRILMNLVEEDKTVINTTRNYINNIRYYYNGLL